MTETEHSPNERPYAALSDGTELERYRIIRTIASGGFGITYLAEHVSLEKTVAIKELFPHQFAYRDHDSLSVTPTDPARFDLTLNLFLQEGRLLAFCDHPNVVRVIDIIESNRTGYMVMEHVEGHNLKSWLKDLDRAPTQAELDDIFSSLTDALQYVHERGILHRDIAPDNIILRENGHACLIDFGAAQYAIASVSQFPPVIKPGYSPPEQYAQSPSDALPQGPWSDVYSLAATIYFTLTGKPPREAVSRQQDKDDINLLKILQTPSAYRQNFLESVNRALRLEAKERPQSVAAWRSELFATGPKKEIEPPPEQQKRWLDARAASVGLLALVLGGGAGAAMLRAVQAPQESNWLTQIANLKKEISELSLSKTSLEVQVAAQNRSSAAELKSQRDALQKQIDELRSQIRAKDVQIQQVETRTRELQQRASTLEDSNRKLQQENSSLAELQTQRDSLQRQVDELTSQIQARDAQIRQADSRINELQQRTSTLEDSNRKLQQENSSLKQGVESSWRQIWELTARKKELETSLQRFNNPASFLKSGVTKYIKNEYIKEAADYADSVNYLNRGVIDFLEVSNIKSQFEEKFPIRVLELDGPITVSGPTKKGNLYNFDVSFSLKYCFGNQTQSNSALEEGIRSMKLVVSAELPERYAIRSEKIESDRAVRWKESFSGTPCHSIF